MSTATPRVKVGNLSLVLLDGIIMYVRTLFFMRWPRLVVADAP